MPHTIRELGRELRDRTISPVELTQECLFRIEKLNPELNAFITVLAESALEDARSAEQEIQRGNYRGPLHGIPIGLKDIIDTAGVRTTAASALFKDRIPTEDAEVVRRLRAAGAIILGKQNLHEFAYGGSSMISFFGEVRNPWDTTRIAGGSSGGSAASVAAGLGFAAIGSDTAGSVRLPAAYCGLVGLKPTYGRVSARGVIPLSWSLDHVGPITSSVDDAALLLQVLAGYDADDPASVDMAVPDFVGSLGQFPETLRVGVPRAFFFEDVHAEVAAAIERAIQVFRELHAEVRDMVLEVSTDRTLSSAESYAYHEAFVAKSPELYQPATLSRIKSAANTSAAAALRARRELEAARHFIRGVFEAVDVLLTPTVPIPPPGVGDLKAHSDNLRPAELLMLRNTRPFNVWGIPAISIPCGFTSDNVPIGLQLAAAPWREDVLLQAAQAYEQATD
ncbi:MAG: Asp-tRNA(Asn)/Glu-tRNA(Gln) amidotransferase GatCAB subunit A [Acidobacteria bacterium]|nr:MAG: Asp-tRNA(Asn)/Glu-tRNA(Gln) amidotransferase GatCAB subunit A [Acidobacteriota bacterium]